MFPFSSRPCSKRCACMSARPGMRNWPVASICVAPPPSQGAGRRARGAGGCSRDDIICAPPPAPCPLTSAIRSPTTHTSPTRTVRDAGSITVTLWISSAAARRNTSRQLLQGLLHPPHPLARFPHREVQRRAEAHGGVAGGENHHVVRHHRLDRGVAHVATWQIERCHQAKPAHVRDELREVLPEALQLADEPGADARRVVDELE